MGCKPCVPWITDCHLCLTSSSTADRNRPSSLASLYLPEQINVRDCGDHMRFQGSAGGSACAINVLECLNIWGEIRSRKYQALNKVGQSCAAAQRPKVEKNLLRSKGKSKSTVEDDVIHG